MWGPLSLGGMVSGRCGVLCPLEGWLVGDVGSFVPWREGRGPLSLGRMISGRCGVL